MELLIMNHITDPQGLAYEGRPYDQHQVDVMEWLASPDGGALRTDQACHVAREIAHGRVPHVSMEQAEAAPLVIDIQPAMITTDGGRTWSIIK